MQHVYARLPGEEREELVEWARAERRRVADQLGYIVSQALRERRSLAEPIRPTDLHPEPTAA
jgi:hypothetical protein